MNNEIKGHITNKKKGFNKFNQDNGVNMLYFCGVWFY